MASPDSHKISLKIIEAIKQHPVLYVSEVKGNAIKLQEFRQKVWKRISDELSLDPGWVKLKWKNLRDTYCRILKYKNKSPKGLKRKKWIFEDHLSFLKFPYEPNYEAPCIELTDDYVNDINREVIGSDFLEQLEENDEDYSEYLEDVDEVMSPAHKVFEISSSSIDIDTYTIPSKFRKIRPKQPDNNDLQIFKAHPQAEEKLLEHNDKRIKLVSKKNNSDVDSFFKSIAETVKKLPLKAQVDIKMDIHKIVSEAVVANRKPRIVETCMPQMIPKLVLVPCKIIEERQDFGNYKI